MKKTLMPLLVPLLLITLLAGVSFATDYTGEVTYLNMKKGVLMVKNQQMEMGFGCDGILMVDLEVGDMVKVDAAREGDVMKVKSITRLDIKETSHMKGKVSFMDQKKGTLIVGNNELKAGFDCSGNILTGVKTGDNVDVGYTVEKGKKMAKTITKM